MQRYVRQCEVVQKLLLAKHTVVATVRREELDRLNAKGGMHSPAIEALTDQSRFSS